jgi:hypothetical protein
VIIGKHGRPVFRIPYGTLVCRYREHLVPHDQFALTNSGHIDSWCKECRREYNREHKAFKAREKRSAVKSCARYPQD